MKKIILALSIFACEAISSNHCLPGGGVPTFTGIKVNGKPVVKEGNKCHTVSKDEVLTPIPCPPQKIR